MSKRKLQKTAKDAIVERIERRVTLDGDVDYGVTVAKDGTTRVERTEFYEGEVLKCISFNETRYPDGRTTIERIEYLTTSDKDFDLVFLPDGSRIVGRVEHASGKVHRNLVTESTGTTVEAGTEH